ncbi:MAG: radical SAM protein, partial [Pyrobaculum sp.]
GGEPLIAPRHLLKVADHLADYTFVVETNGLLITRDLAREFANRPQVIVRVSIKGATPEEFSKITQSPPYYFHRQIEAIKILVESGLKPCVDVYPAAMLGFSTDETIKSLEETLAGVDPRLSDCIDVEYVILYPHVVNLLRARGLTPTKAVTPSGIPTFMI